MNQPVQSSTADVSRDVFGSAVHVTPVSSDNVMHAGPTFASALQLQDKLKNFACQNKANQERRRCRDSVACCGDSVVSSSRLDASVVPCGLTPERECSFASPSSL